MVKDHTYSEREEILCSHMGYTFQEIKGYFICAPFTDRIAHTTAFVTPVVEHWLEREIAQWVNHEGSIRRPIGTMRERSITELHFVPFWIDEKKNTEINLVYSI